jgi:hypothetical protein
MGLDIQIKLCDTNLMVENLVAVVVALAVVLMAHILFHAEESDFNE